MLGECGVPLGSPRRCNAKKISCCSKEEAEEEEPGRGSAKKRPELMLKGARKLPRPEEEPEPAGSSGSSS